MTTDPFMYAAFDHIPKGYIPPFPTPFPCDIRSDTVLLYGTQSDVIGDNCTIAEPKRPAHSQNAELDLSDDAQVRHVIQEFFARQPELWNEDTGE